MEISVCIITKNERKKLERCLTCLKPSGFELVVVDTGSEDGSVDMARGFTDSVFDFCWIDDFAAAKNYAISKAKHDMVLIVDSDEYWIEGQIEPFLQQVEKYNAYVGRITRRESFRTETGDKGESIVGAERVFDRRRYHFAGRIHEQVVEGSVFDENRDDTRDAIRRQKSPVKVYDTGLLFDHDGYDGTQEDRKKKAERNLRLLMDEHRLVPEDVYIIYQIAKSVYFTDGATEAIRWYEKALDHGVDPEKEWGVDLITCYGYALLEVQQYERATNLERYYGPLSEQADYLFLMGLIFMNTAQFERAINEFIRCTQLSNARAAGVDSYKAFYNAGVIEECLGHREIAASYYQNAGDYEPARKGLERVK
ncbi:MAG: glycosyltransferase [Eubacterium sp.]|nr:glycosyltransferase [Eubacterium sp.]